MQQATSAGASEYAADSLKAAQDADAALDAELKAQQDKFSMFRSVRQGRRARDRGEAGR